MLSDNRKDKRGRTVVKNVFFGKRDAVLLLSVSVAALLLFLIFLLIPNDGKYAVVRSDGEIAAKLPLNENTTYTVKNSRGYNVITVKDGRVSVTDASCPDGICRMTGWISGSDDLSVIVCAPNGITVSIEE